ncbi:MAG: hypothetical protein HC915_10485 [Anaerolineae bacterium]|nr:hypothetical protein [Anaerolineae bacterium]
MLEVISMASGLSPAEIVQTLRESELTLGEIVTANGGDLAEVEAELTALLTAQLEARLEANTERLNTQLENVDQWVQDLLNGNLGGGMAERLQDRRQDRRADRDFPLISAVTEAIQAAAGVEPGEIAEQVRAGSTLAEVIASYGLDEAAIVAEVEAALTERINAAVEEGTITQLRADELLAGMDEAIQNILTTTPGGRRDQALAQRAVNRAAAEALGILPADLRLALAEGQTLADFISSSGGDVEAVRAAALADLEAAAAEAVERGPLTQAEADERLAAAPAAIDDALNTPTPPPPSRLPYKGCSEAPL